MIFKSLTLIAVTMVGSESAVCVAGDYSYLFFNKNDSKAIDFWKVKLSTREKKAYQVTVNGKTDLSNGGAIACVYVPRNDEINLFFIGTDPETQDLSLREVMLKGAKTVTEPKAWAEDKSLLNSKGFAIDGESMLCAALNDAQEPRVFFRRPKRATEVSFGEYKVVETGAKGKDWMTTPITGLGS